MKTVSAYFEKNFPALEDKLEIKFNEPNKLVQAFIHRSYLNEHRTFPLANNERLEFLGDAVLELIVTEYLFLTYLNPEGELTNWRAALVNGSMCAQTAREIGLEPYLFLSHGEEKDKNIKARDYILANTFEALVGSIYLDQGWETTKKFVYKWIISKLPTVLELGLWLDAKTKLQEAAQEKLGITPIYKVIHSEGPDHAKKFVVGVYFDKKQIATGEGSSKQEAQIQAAENALQIKGWHRHKTKIIYRDKNK